MKRHPFSPTNAHFQGNETFAFNFTGFYSFRNEKGSWFIQSLCKELNASDNLLQILTRTSRRVTQLESKSDEKEFHGKKQVPSVTTMLTRDLYFQPKKSDDSHPNAESDLN
jgi:hypothetical protein